MKVYSVLALCAILVSSFAGNVDACARRNKNVNTNRGNTVVVTVRNELTAAEPTPNPTPPPPPPPLSTGFVPPPPLPPASKKTRTNCDARVEFHIAPQDENAATSGQITRDDVQEVWTYSCTFSMYVEVAIEATETPQQCACGVTLSKYNPVVGETRPYSTKVNNFRMVAFDTVNLQRGGEFAANTFATMNKNDNTTRLLEELAGTPKPDYSQVAVAYAGEISSVPTEAFPPELQSTSTSYNPNMAPAMCFDVTEDYITTYKWPEPPFPVMSTTPNVWLSPCYPLYNYGSYSAKRNSRQKLWLREFYLFPREDSATSSFTPRPRYLTSFYKDSNCNVENGVVTFDREFISKLGRFPQVYGAFKWTRTFTSAWVVGGVPKEFSDPSQYYADGFTKVTWHEVYGRTADGQNYRPGVVYHALLGTEAVNDMPFIGATKDTKLCQSVPKRWEDCAEGGEDCADLRANTYGENAFFFRIKDAERDGENPALDCRRDGLIDFCDEDVTLLSFQNRGALSRDYQKRDTSILLTGLRSRFCLTDVYPGLFDPLFFKPYSFASDAKKQLRKRSILDENDAAKEWEAVSHLKNNGNGLLPDNEIGLDIPDVNDEEVRPAVGSTDKYGRRGGDHPVSLFPETYTVPITLDPEDTTYDQAFGTITIEQPPCLVGEKGCTCRAYDAESTRPRCDAPLVCNEMGFCAEPPCLAGDAGCECMELAKCGSDELKCNSNNRCEYARTCIDGEAGCQCDLGQCVNGDLFCNSDNICSKKDTEDSPCTRGTAGCKCDANDECSEEGFRCNVFSGQCEAIRCDSGMAGCSCELGRCEAGFQCSTDDVCEVKLCPPGDAGCRCNPDNSCNSPSYDCQNFGTVEGSEDRRCVANGKDCHSDMQERCVLFCGEGNVERCPPCSNQLPLCGSAGTVLPSAAIALLLAALAAMF